MKIAVFGGTGMVGSRVVAEALARGHEVTSITRRPDAPVPAGVNPVIGDATDAGTVAHLAAEHDVVVSALGPSRAPDGDRSLFLDAIDTLASNVGSTRLFVVGGAGCLLAAPGVRLVDLPEFPEIYQPEALIQADALELLRARGPELDWTYFSPAPEIAPGARTGTYTLGVDAPVGERISVEDYAVALVDELEEPAHRRTRFTAAN